MVVNSRLQFVRTLAWTLGPPLAGFLASTGWRLPSGLRSRRRLLRGLRTDAARARRDPPPAPAGAHPLAGVVPPRVRLSLAAPAAARRHPGGDPGQPRLRPHGDPARHLLPRAPGHQRPRSHRLVLRRPLPDRRHGGDRRPGHRPAARAWDAPSSAAWRPWAAASWPWLSPPRPSRPCAPGWATVAAVFPAGLAVIGVSFVNVTFTTLRQQLPPAELRGRVIAASRTLSWAGLPVGAALGGAAAAGLRGGAGLPGLRRGHRGGVPALVTGSLWRISRTRRRRAVRPAQPATAATRCEMRSVTMRVSVQAVTGPSASLLPAKAVVSAQQSALSPTSRRRSLQTTSP